MMCTSGHVKNLEFGEIENENRFLFVRATMKPEHRQAAEQ